MASERTYVVSENIQWAVVGIRLLVRPVPNKVLCNKVTSTWVQTARQERGHDEVYESTRTHSLKYDGVEGDLDGDVQEMPPSELLRADESGSQGVEKYLERAGRGKKSAWRSAKNCACQATNAKNAFPATLLSSRASIRVGTSVSIPSTPNCL